MAAARTRSLTIAGGRRGIDAQTRCSRCPGTRWSRRRRDRSPSEKKPARSSVGLGRKLDSLAMAGGSSDTGAWSGIRAHDGTVAAYGASIMAKLV